VSKTGNFIFDAPRAKIVWVNLPPEPEFVVKFIMNTGSVTGPAVFNQKLYYVDESGKKEFEAEPLNVTIDPSGASTTTSFPETSVASSNNSPGSSDNASTAGSSGNTGSSGSESSTSNTVASSGSSGNSGSTDGNTAGASSTTLASAGSSGNSGSASGAETKTKENTSGSGSSSSSSGTSGGITAKKENPSVSGSSGLVYKVQLGAYGADPGKARFSGAGKITISKEDGLYKVVTGNYNTKEEAVKANEALKSKGFSGFVVKYQNGVRVK
jgi:hypothetical protein